MAELRTDLKSDKKERKKEAVKKIIASMTVGKDVRYVSRKRCSKSPPLLTFFLCMYILTWSELSYNHQMSVAASVKTKQNNVYVCSNKFLIMPTTGFVSKGSLFWL